MLQKLRDQTQSFGFKLLAGVIVFVLAVFGFGAFNLFVNTDPEVASVNGKEISQSVLLAEVERQRRRLAAQLGEDFDPNMIDAGRLQSSVLEQLIARSLLQQLVEDLDMGVSKLRVDETVTGNPMFQVDGRFEPNAYRRTVQAMLYSPQEFLEETEELLALEQLQQGISETAFLTDWELRLNAKLLNQRRDIAYLPFTVERFSNEVEVSDEDVALRYQENELDYQTEEAVDVAYVTLAVDDLLEDPAIAVTEDDLQAAYEAEAAAALTGERRAGSHILLQVTEERTAAQAERLLLDLKDRVARGASFEELAREHSDDAGSAAAGGALGMVGKGVFDPEFERVLWSLAEAGDLSDPVRTEFGYHLIRLDDVEQVEYPSFESQRADLERRLRRDEARLLFVERVRELDNLAFEQPDTLDGIAAALGLEIRTRTGVTRTEGSGLFGNVALRDALFTGDVLDRGYNTPALELGEDRAVVARVTARHEPRPIPLEEVQDDIRAELVAERARVLAEQAFQDALVRVGAGESVAEVADDHGVEWQRFELASRNRTDVPQTVIAAAFALPRPADGAKSVGSAALPASGHAVVTVTRVQDGDLTTMAESEIESIRGVLVNRVGNLDFGGLFETLERDARVQRAIQ